MNFRVIGISVLVSFLNLTVSAQLAAYSMPFEESPHEGTWLQWPHNYTYGGGAEDVEYSWVAMTQALISGENVHIIAYNSDEVVL